MQASEGRISSAEVVHVQPEAQGLKAAQESQRGGKIVHDRAFG
jgi:hypothetical protein